MYLHESINVGVGNNIGFSLPFDELHQDFFTTQDP